MNTVIDMSKVSERKELAPVSETTSLIAVIERAARDPSVDVVKLRELLAIRKEVAQEIALEAYNAAFAEMQPELPEIDERGQIKVGEQVRSTYAKFEDINAVVKPILARHGFGISFKPLTKENKAHVTATLMHRAGHRESAEMELGADTSGSKNGVQALGSSISYAKRYLMEGLLNITTRGQDDDGRKAGADPTLSEQQIADLKALITEHGGNLPKLLKYWKITALDQIPAKNYKHCLDEVKRFAQQRAEQPR